jgi:hypothetical protein
VDRYVDITVDGDWTLWGFWRQKQFGDDFYRIGFGQEPTYSFMIEHPGLKSEEGSCTHIK